jgi:hypothetical protein
VARAEVVGDVLENLVGIEAHIALLVGQVSVTAPRRLGYPEKTGKVNVDFRFFMGASTVWMV